MAPFPEALYNELESIPAFVPDYFQALKELEEGDGSELKAIALHFLSETQARLGRLARAIAQNDFQEVSSLSHTLKGSLATFGLGRAAEVARRLESAAEAGDLETLVALEPLLAPAIAPGRSRLEQELETMGPQTGLAGY